jgi:hypothetical protein
LRSHGGATLRRSAQRSMRSVGEFWGGRRAGIRVMA